MDAKTYAQQQLKIVEAWNSYASKGDTDSAMFVDRDVRKFMADTGEKDYGTALKARREQVRGIEVDISHAPSVSQSSGDDMQAGVELDKIAQRNREIDPTLNYTAAFKLACLENPKLASRYLNRDVRAGQVSVVQEHFSKVHAEVKTYDDPRGPTPYQIIGKIISATPKTDAHRPDVDAILRAVNGYGGDTLAQAAREKLDVLVRDEIAQSSEPASDVNAPGGEGKAAIRSRVERMFKEIVLVSQGGSLNERSLRQMYPQLMK